jgi:zinc transport system substrate-binding protein
LLPRRLTACLFVLALLLAACAGEGETAASDAAAADDTTEDQSAEAGDDEAVAGEGLTVVTTVFPLADMAQTIAPGADVTLLTSSGQDPHDLELTPQDRALIEGADVVLYMGDIDFQPQVESAVADATGAVVSVADIAGTGNLLDFDGHSHDDEHGHDDDDEHGHDDDDEHGHDDDDEHGHDDDDEHGHDDDDEHGHDDDEAVDPHLWFSATIMAEVAEEIGQVMADMDTDNTDVLVANSEALHDELRALEGELDTLLEDCTRDYAIVSHEAYAFLLEPRGFEQEGISGAGGHGDASPQRLAELTEKIRDEDIPAVLAEPLEGRADAESLANEAGVDLLEIDPLEIGQDELFEMGYVEALRQQAQTFATAMECG